MSTKIRLIALAILSGSAAASEPVGVTEPGRHIDLTFPEPGVIRVIEVAEGNRVKTGQLLVQLDCRVLEAQHEIARRRAEGTAAIQAANATVKMKQQRLEQLERLAESDRANADELSRARAETEIALADLDLAREAVVEHALEAKQIEAQIEQRTLRAPFDGVIAELRREIGASVGTRDEPVLTLVKLDELDLVAHLDQRLLDRVHVGDEIPVTALDRPVTTKARVDFISPVVDASSGTARVRLLLPNAEGQHRSGVKYRIDLPEP